MIKKSHPAREGLNAGFTTLFLLNQAVQNHFRFSAGDAGKAMKGVHAEGHFLQSQDEWSGPSQLEIANLEVLSYTRLAGEVSDGALPQPLSQQLATRNQAEYQDNWPVGQPKQKPLRSNTGQQQGQYLQQGDLEDITAFSAAGY